MSANNQKLIRSGAAGFEPLEVNSPMAKWKKPQSLDFVTGATERFSYRNWQSGNDDSVYYNLNIPTFFHSRVVMPPKEFSVLKRDIWPELLDLTFTAHDGATTPPLKDYLVGPRQVQAMMMAHKGKVVFEIYPGMNPTDMHVWMSASKTTASLLITMLWEQGNLDFDQPVPTYVPELKGTPWDNVTIANAMNMATGLDVEESFDPFFKGFRKIQLVKKNMSRLPDGLKSEYVRYRYFSMAEMLVTGLMLLFAGFAFYLCA
jgi:hypothetical protein